MSRSEKRLEKAKSNPKGVSLNDLLSVSRAAGAVHRKGGRNHWIIRFPDGQLITVKEPHGKNTKTVLPVYVKLVLEAIEDQKAD